MTSREQLIAELESLERHRDQAILYIHTLGQFSVSREGVIIQQKAWGRDKTIQLLQFFVTHRHRRALHKEQIIEYLWPGNQSKDGDRDFKVALHGIHKTLEPDRDGQSEPVHILRQGVTYFLNLNSCSIDADLLEQYIKLANKSKRVDPALAKDLYYRATTLHRGTYLPERLFEDWSSEERERLQVIILGAYIDLAELTLEDSPMESIRLAQLALIIDHTWEDAYRIQMLAYHKNSNRPAAIKVYRQCCRVLEEEFDIDPLPETQRLYDKIMQ